jgi:hypothetical protein
MLPLLGENLSVEGAALTHCVVASVCTVAAHALALLLQAIITPTRGAVTGLYTACAQYTVTRCATLETGGLTVVSAYLPRVSVALNAGRLSGDPRRASCHGHVAGPAPLPPRGRHVATPDPSPGEGGSGPPRPVGAGRPVMV